MSKDLVAPRSSIERVGADGRLAIIGAHKNHEEGSTAAIKVVAAAMSRAKNCQTFSWSKQIVSRSDL